MRLLLAALAAFGIAGERGTPQRPPVAVAAAMPCTARPIIHVYLDVSGSVFATLPTHPGQTGFSLSLQALREHVAPEIDDIGAELRLYTFGGDVQSPLKYDATVKFEQRLEELKLNPRAAQSSTDLTRVWGHVLDQVKRTKVLQGFLIFSDFAHSSVVKGAASREGPSSDGRDQGEALADWSAFVKARSQDMRAPMESGRVRLVKLPTLARYEEQQKHTLAVLEQTWSKLSGIAVAVDEPQEWQRVGSVIPRVELRLVEGGARLELRNGVCRSVVVTGLRLVRDGLQVTEPQPADELLPGEATTWTSVVGYARVGVLGKPPNSVVADRLVSDELTVQLSPADINVNAFLLGNTLQVFVSPRGPVGLPIDGQGEVLVREALGDTTVAQGPFELKPDAARPVKFEGRAKWTQVRAIEKSKLIRLRLTPAVGEGVAKSDVPVIILPATRIDHPQVFLHLAPIGGVILGLIRLYTNRWLRSGAVALSALGALWISGSMFVWVSAFWVQVAVGALTALVGLIAWWCLWRITQPAEIRSLEKLIQLQRGQRYETVLVPTGYRWARVYATLGALVVSAATWWLLTHAFVDVAAQQPSLEMLQQLSESVFTG